MGVTWWRGAVAVMLALAVGLPLIAEQPAQADERPVPVTQGRGLPEYYGVSTFFMTVDFSYRTPGIWRRFRQEIDLEEGSEAEKVLLLATYAFDAIMSERLGLSTWGNDPVAAQKIQRDYLRSRVHRHGKVWRQFLQDWKKAGQSEQVVREWIEANMPHQMRIFTTDTPTPEEQREHDEIVTEFHDLDGQD